MKRLLLLTFLLISSYVAKALTIDTWEDTNGTIWSFQLIFRPSGGTYAIINGVRGTIPNNLEIPSTVYHNESPYPVDEIQVSVFSNFSNLNSVTIPESVTSIGSSAFSGCSNLTSINIPDGVMSIQASVFSGCSSLTSITIPDGVTSIGSSAFSGCSSLASITIPDGVTSIGNSSFSDCTSLTSITIPNSVTSIGSSAFSGCSNLTSINIPASITSIGSSAFEGCTSLPVEGELRYADTYLVEAVDKTQETYEIKEHTRFIGSSAFSNCSSLTSITIPNSVTSIGSSAFEGCSSLTTISIPEDVTSIGSSAFSGCSNLTSINIPDGVMSIQASVFSGCSSLTSITIPDGVTSIGSSAFSGCSSLTSVNIPESVTSIGSSAFSGCSNLTSINIPASITSIGSSAFEGCTSLTSVTINSDAIMSTSGIRLAGIFGAQVIEYIVGEEVTLIDYSAFSGCMSLTSVSIGNGVTSIGNSAFYQCSKLVSVTIGNSVESIGGGAFSGCSSLASVNIPESVTSIGSSAFFDCTSLTSINIPESVTSIGEYTFYHCSSLTSVTIGNGVTSIGNSAFYQCSNLTSINIPEGVTSIGSQAFSGCSYMDYMSFMSATPLTNTDYMPNNTTVIFVPDAAVDDYKTAWSDYQHKIVGIGNNAWKEYTLTAQEDYSDLAVQVGEENLRNITKLRLSGTMNSYDMMVIRNKMINLQELDLENVNIVENPYEYYTGCHSEDNVFGAYFLAGTGVTSVIMPTSITSIGNYAFNRCTKLHSVTNLSDNITIISSGAFYGCYKLTGIDLPEKLAVLGSDAFVLSGLTSIRIPEGVTIAPNRVFGGCSNLESVYLSKETTKIGEYAFDGCALQEINLPPALNSIGDNAFYGCNNLKKIYAYMPDVPALSTNSFSTYQTATLYVPEFLYNSYFYDTNWSQFLSIEKCSLNPDDYLKLATNQDVTFAEEDERIPDTSEDEHIDGEVGNQGGIIVEGDEPQPFDEMDQNINGEGQGGSLIGEDDGETPGNLPVNTLNVKIQVKANKWYFFCFPYDVTIADCEYPGQYAWREYDGLIRAMMGSNGWKNVEGASLAANKGYIFQSSAAGTLVVKFEAPVFGGDRPQTLIDYICENTANASWNFVGNPYSCFYEFTDEDFDAPITVWNGTSYEAYRPGDDDYHMQPYEAFFVQKPTETSIIDFKQDNRETYHQSQEKKTMNAKALRMKGIKPERLLVNLNISDNDTSAVDKTRLVLNVKASRDYEMTCDAAKFISNDANAQLYTLEGNVQMAINERPTEGDIRLGYKAKKAGTLSIEAPRMDLPMALVDTKTGTTFDLSLGNYEFKTEAGTFNTRFLLRPTEEATAIKDMTQKTGVAIGLQDGGLSIGGADGKNVEIYTVGGALTAQKSGNGFVSLPRGTYLVKVDGASAKIHVK